MSQAGVATQQSGNLPPDVPLYFQGNTGVGSAVAHVFDIVGTGSVSTSVSGNVLTITASSFTWQVVTSANNPVTLTANNGYIAKGPGVVQFVLPAASAVGDTFKIIGYGNLWTIAQNAGQSITIGFVTSTAGVGGSVTATMISDRLTLVCVTSNLEFYDEGIQGNITII